MTRRGLLPSCSQTLGTGRKAALAHVHATPLRKQLPLSTDPVGRTLSPGWGEGPWPPTSSHLEKFSDEARDPSLPPSLSRQIPALAELPHSAPCTGCEGCPLLAVGGRAVSPEGTSVTKEQDPEEDCELPVPGTGGGGSGGSSGWVPPQPPLYPVLSRWKTVLRGFLMEQKTALYQDRPGSHVLSIKLSPETR